MNTFIQKYLKDQFDFHLKARTGSLLNEIKDRLPKNHVYIILDDDPTGTQTVHDINVYTTWDSVTLEEIFNSGEQLVFILTNSRALTEDKAVKLAKEIGLRIKKQALRSKKRFTMVSRGDSTLRGHFPAEVDALLLELGQEEAVKMIIPSFFPGGRYTFGDVHYVREGNELIPAAETPFAKDKSFGYESSNLRHWIKEKYKGGIEESQIQSISLEQIRIYSNEGLSDLIMQMPDGCSCIINATEPSDLEQIVLATQQVKRTIFFRTAASLIPILIGQVGNELLTKEDLANHQNTGNLIVVGSYVPKTSSQLNYLIKQGDLETVEIDVSQLFGFNTRVYLDAKINYCSDLISKGRDVVIFTSRELKFGTSAKENLKIGKTISNALVILISGLKVLPKNIIAKGGITSSDIATKALKIRKAKVLGQILPGIPVWQFGENQRYIVFPGNVGDETALFQAYKKL